SNAKSLLETAHTIAEEVVRQFGRERLFESARGKPRQYGGCLYRPQVSGPCRRTLQEGAGHLAEARGPRGGCLGLRRESGDGPGAPRPGLSGARPTRAAANRPG